MPNRIIKESIKRSPEIDKLSWFEEVVFYRLIVTADDYGRLDGRMVVLKNDLFPTKETVTKKAVEDAIDHLVSVGLLVLYEDAESGMPYLAFRKWDKHQRVRDSKAKYPPPPDDLMACGNSRQSAANRSENPLARAESESESNPNPIQHQPDARAVMTVQRYARENLTTLGARAMDEINSFIDDLSEDIVRHAIDNALDDSARSWSYVRAILNRYCEEGIKSVGEAKASDEKWRQRRKHPEQTPREYKDADYENDW